MNGYGEWSAMIKFKIVNGAFGKDWLINSAIMAKMRCLHAELAGPDPSAVEVMLADLVVIAWADWCRCAMDCEALTDLSLKQAAYYDQRADRSHKRLIRSLRALAAVRKVDLTAIQLNLNGVVGQIGDDGRSALDPGTG